jgi:hypothetical protein
MSHTIFERKVPRKWVNKKTGETKFRVYTEKICVECRREREHKNSKYRLMKNIQKLSVLNPLEKQMLKVFHEVNPDYIPRAQMRILNKTIEKVVSERKKYYAI